MKKNNKSVQEIFDLFVQSAEKQGVYIGVGDSRQANRAYYKKKDAFQSLQAFGKEGVDVLVESLKHSNDWVRMSAAAYLLDYEPNLAIPILEQIAKDGKGFVAINAEYTLRGWRKKQVNK